MSHPCPRCGYCPTCGRNGYPYPQYPYYSQPHWHPHWWGDNNVVHRSNTSEAVQALAGKKVR